MISRNETDTGAPTERVRIIGANMIARPNRVPSRWRRAAGCSFLGFAVLLAPTLFASAAAEAGWLTRLIGDAGEAGTSAARRGVDGPNSLGDLSAAAKRLKKRPGETVLAATVSNADHWTFSNAADETFTAANPTEMARAVGVLAPDALGRNITVVVADTVAVANREALKLLPDAVSIRVHTRGGVFPLVPLKAPALSGPGLAIRPNLLVPVATTKSQFDAALWQLGRSFKPSNVTVLSLKRGRPSRPPKLLDKSSGMHIATQEVAFDRVLEAFPSLERRTVVLTGRINGETLTFRTATGGREDVPLGPLRAAATKHDISLVLLNAPGGRQPGVRNWLWQKASVDGLATAIKSPTMADFLSRISGSERMIVRAGDGRPGRMQLRIEPEVPASDAIDGGLVSGWISQLLVETAGKAAVGAIEIDTPDRGRQTEIDRRIVPGIPSWFQLFVIAGFLCGVLALGLAWSWWSRIWPAETRKEYASRTGFVAARVARTAVFLVLFLPIVGVPAFVALILRNIWTAVTLPFRLIHWLIGRRANQSV